MSQSHIFEHIADGQPINFVADVEVSAIADVLHATSKSVPGLLATFSNLEKMQEHIPTLVEALAGARGQFVSVVYLTTVNTNTHPITCRMLFAALPHIFLEDVARSGRAT